MKSRKSGKAAKEEYEGPSLSKTRLAQQQPELLERVAHLVEEV